MWQGENTNNHQIRIENRKNKMNSPFLYLTHAYTQTKQLQLQLKTNRVYGSDSAWNENHQKPKKPRIGKSKGFNWRIDLKPKQRWKRIEMKSERSRRKRHAIKSERERDLRLGIRRSGMKGQLGWEREIWEDATSEHWDEIAAAQRERERTII